MEFIGLVPCAGKGSRLGAAFSKEVFPDLMSSNYRPIIMYTIEAMQAAGIKHIIFIINPYKTDLMNFLGNGSKFGLNFTYCIHPSPKSLPESLMEAYHLIKNKNIIFAMPDTVIYPMQNLKSVKEDFEKNSDKYDAVFGCFRTNNPTKFGMVKYKEDVISEIIDKPKQTNLEWMWGNIAWGPNFTEILNNNIYQSDKELILTEIIEELIENKKTKCHKFEKGFYKDLGTFDEIKEWIRKGELL